MSLLRAGREAREQTPTVRTNSDVSTLRLKMETRKRSLEQLHLQAMDTSTSVTEEVAGLKAEGLALAAALQEAEATITKMSGLAASQAAQLRKLREKVSSEKGTQKGISKPVGASQTVRVVSWSPQFRSGSHPALVRNQSAAASYFTTILRRNLPRVS